MSDLSVECSLVGIDAGTADGLIGDLQEHIAHELPAANTSRVRKDPRTQDFGLTLAIVLGSPSVAALAGVLSNWLQSRSEAELNLSLTDVHGRTRKIKIRGQPGKRQHKIIEDFFNND